MMNYSKPSVLATVPALVAVQSDMVKDNALQDNPQPIGTSAAYEADE
ncbi:hypothetical protein ACFQBQ_16370 [Granulicella cerasi]|uniref:Uncharacterized protein n=1 Tax=Granulicella cerasi TaxID=741063 RepID=A0ABW1ZFB5_9BACT|nr:hypothetical protein [Granulicella cerasi]